MKKINAELEFAYLLNEFGFTNFEECSEEDNKKYAEILEKGDELPDGVIPKLDEYGKFDGTFYLSDGDVLCDKDKHLYLQMKKIKCLEKSRNILLYIAALVTITAAVTLLNLIYHM